MRQNPFVRSLSTEVKVSVDQMIQPLFVVEGLKSRETIPGLTGTFRDTPQSLIAQVEADLAQGVSKFLLFGVPSTKKLKDFDPSFTASQISSLKKHFGDRIFLAVDVCLCSSTAHGQCGILNDSGDHLDNSATVEELVKASLRFAEAGADCVAPSDMMDGRIGAIREALDEAGLERTVLMSYAAKFHSRFYGPFRVAADSAPKGDVKLKDRATYQIDPARPSDAFESAFRDAEEGADILMVKPGLPYLDILYRLSQEISKPWAVYEVSGEFAGIELMAEKGLVNGPLAHVESWISLTRAGASMIITYGARNAREWLAARGV
jgi:porphobilinogen synthase